MTDGPAASTLTELRTAVSDARVGSADAVAPLGQVCRACAQLLPVDGASISALDASGVRDLLYASDPVIARVEQLEFTLGEGPCYEAFMSGRPVLVANLAQDAASAWPVFAAQMADEPVGALFAFPLRYGAARVGALDMYRTSPGWLTPDELATALQVADIAASAMIGPADGVDGKAWLASLPRDREQVHQATGMLIAEFAILPVQALSLLRGHAFASGRMVEEVAADLVNRLLHPRDLGP